VRFAALASAGRGHNVVCRRRTAAAPGMTFEITEDVAPGDELVVAFPEIEDDAKEEASTPHLEAGLMLANSLLLRAISGIMFGEFLNHFQIFYHNNAHSTAAAPHHSLLWTGQGRDGGGGGEGQLMKSAVSDDALAQWSSHYEAGESALCEGGVGRDLITERERRESLSDQRSLLFLLQIRPWISPPR